MNSTDIDKSHSSPHHTRTCACTHTHVHTHTHMRAHTHTRMHTCMHAHTHTHTHTHAQTEELSPDFIVKYGIHIPSSPVSVCPLDRWCASPCGWAPLGSFHPMNCYY